MELAFASPEDEGTPFDAPLSAVEDVANAGAAFEAAGRLLKRVSPGAESVCFSEVVTLLEVASLFAFALSVTAGFGDITLSVAVGVVDVGVAFEVTGRFVKRVSPETESTFLSDCVTFVEVASLFALALFVAESFGDAEAVFVDVERFVKRVSLELESGFFSGRGTLLEVALFITVGVVDVGAAFELVERLLKRVSPGAESVCCSEVVTLLGIALSVTVDV